MEAWYLILARLLRSIGQGSLLVDFPLYLSALSWNPIAIGELYTTGLLLNGALAFFLGPLSDRYGRKKFMVFFQALLIVCALTAFLTTNRYLLAAAAILGGFGRSGGGGSGPFASVEVAWLADLVPTSRRTHLFNINNSLTFVGQGVGTLLAVVPELLIPHMGKVPAFRFLFLTVLLCALISTFFVALAPDRPASQQTEESEPLPRADRRKENLLLATLVGLNILNGLSLGLVMPLLPYWFKLRYGVGPFTVGPIFTMALFMTAISSLLTTRWVQRFGLISTITAMRSVGLGCLLGMIFSPSIGLAGIFYVLRAFFNRGNMGARQSLVANLTQNRYGLALSLNMVSTIFPIALGPTLCGFFFAHHQLLAPLFLSAAAQVLYLVGFYLAFAREFNHAS
ncbi:MFS transporter [Desulfothermobacter acidiphilus]|uniref:MFS transporter n=1 Tax=Desulfothermobacter acidiphilus TaxID=1938353 RepID=UPI003F8AF73F